MTLLAYRLFILGMLFFILGGVANPGASEIVCYIGIFLTVLSLSIWGREGLEHLLRRNKP